MYFERRQLAQSLKELVSPLDAFGLSPTVITGTRHSVLAARGCPAGTYQIRVDVRDEVIDSWITLDRLPGYGGLPVRLDVNLLLEAAGRADRKVTQDDVRRASTIEQVLSIIARERDSFMDFGLHVLLGPGALETVDAVYALIQDLPGDPRFDWWAYRRHQSGPGGALS